MDMFEKVEMLRQRANVSYEEAKIALEKSNGDVLDAMILLERESRTAGTCGADEAGSRKAADDGKGLGSKIKSLLHKSTVNYLAIDRKNERILRIPVLAAILILLFAWYAAVIAVVVSLFLDCKYSFEGESDMKAANEVCGRAGELAEQVKDKVVTEYNNL